MRLILVAGMPAVTFGEAQLGPARGAIDLALEALGIHKGFHHQNGMAVARLPVAG